MVIWLDSLLNSRLIDASIASLLQVNLTQKSVKVVARE